MRPGGGWGSGNENGESDALQADVMRFVAIIALCLAAIFSLLSGIRNTPELEPRERISRPPADPSDRRMIPEPTPVMIPAVRAARIIS